MPLPSYEVLQPGALFHDRYRIVSCIKAGGMGAVYEIIDEKTDSHRALKVMLPSLVEDADLRARFELEARVTGKIESDHLARVSDAGVDDVSGMPFLVMDLLRGEDLGALLAKRKVLPPGEVVLFLFEAALALDKTHAAGIVHRDLKPENLFVTKRDDGSPCIKVFDFGIAKIVDRGSARATRPMGTPLYMSPEQVRGDGHLGPPADLYALGHIAYTLLTGEPYWNEEIQNGPSLFATLSTVVLGPNEPASTRARRRRGVTLPAAFDAWFVKATASRPEDRFQRATMAITELAVALGVSLPRASIYVQTIAATPIAATSTVPIPAAPTEVLPRGSSVTPTEMMSGPVSSLPPPVPQKSKQTWVVGISMIAALILAAALFASRLVSTPNVHVAVKGLQTMPLPMPVQVVDETAPPEKAPAPVVATSASGVPAKTPEPVVTTSATAVPVNVRRPAVKATSAPPTQTSEKPSIF